MDNVVIYARFSSSKQQEQSIDGQLRYCREYANRYGYKVVGEYCDRAITGQTDQRPQFQKMISDSASKKFKYILVWKLDRFSRDRYASALYKYKLKNNGVKVLSVTESIGDGDESIILEAVLEAMAEIYVRQLSQNTKRGAKEAILQGRSAGGVIPFGYSSVDKHLVVNEPEAAVVRRAFQLYADGVMIRDICAEFRERGYRTRTGGEFNRNSFHRMFQNEKYIGTVTYIDIVIENGCPAIVDRDTFEKCRRRLLQNKRAVGKPSKTKIEYLLKGKAFCGLCGAAMVGDSGTSMNGTRHEYYSCAARKKLKNCKKAREKKDYIEWYVVEQTVKYVLQPDRLDYIAQNVVRMYNESIDTSELDELTKKKAKYEKEYERVADSLIHASTQRLIDKINRRAAELDVLLNEIDTKIAGINAQIANALTADDVKLWMKAFCVGDALDVDFRRKIIDVLVNSVYIYDDKIVIYFNVRDGKQVSYTQMQDETVDIFDDMNCSTNPNCSDIVSNGSPFKAISELQYYIFVDGRVGIVVRRPAPSRK